MEAKKSPLSIRIIYWLTNIAAVLYIFSSAVLFVLIILLLFGRYGDNLQLHTDLPVKVDFLNKGVLQFKGEAIHVQLVEAQGKIHFIDTPKSIVKAIMPAISLFVPIFGYLLWVFRGFIKNVKNSIIFDLKNISYLKKLAYGLMGLWLLMVIYARVFYYTIANNIRLENAEITSERPEYTGLLLVGLFIWMLAHIFKVGLDLQQEKELTI
jgi:hypothetical protein